MRANEAKYTRDRKGLNPFLWWAYRYRLSAAHGERKRGAANHFHGDDGGTRLDEHPFTPAEFTYRIAIVVASSGTFAVGIGQCLTAIVSR